MMRVKKKLTWLLLLLRLPATHKAERVAIWRKVKKSGAIQIQTSTYILPDEPARYELFQWLTQEIRSAGGDATLVRGRGRKSTASAPAGSSENSSIPRRSLSLRKGSRPMVAPFRSTCLTLNSRITEKTVRLKRCSNDFGSRTKPRTKLGK